jgi:hypothetical protein
VTVVVSLRPTFRMVYLIVPSLASLGTESLECCVSWGLPAGERILLPVGVIGALPSGLGMQGWGGLSKGLNLKPGVCLLGLWD